MFLQQSFKLEMPWRQSVVTVLSRRLNVVKGLKRTTNQMVAFGRN
jgi:hypothetical protein